MFVRTYSIARASKIIVWFTKICSVLPSAKKSSLFKTGPEKYLYIVDCFVPLK